MGNGELYNNFDHLAWRQEGVWECVHVSIHGGDGVDGGGELLWWWTALVMVVNCCGGSDEMPWLWWL